jgi:hypothetical protein
MSPVVETNVVGICAAGICVDAFSDATPLTAPLPLITACNSTNAFLMSSLASAGLSAAEFTFAVNTFDTFAQAILVSFCYVYL